jgi:Pyruvate/2-oxoacid:ferredoxin oxidoreductase delta subunit
LRRVFEMCEFCDRFGDGKLWYLNPKNFARQLYHRKMPGQEYVPEAIAYRKEREAVRFAFDRARLERNQEKMEQLRSKLDQVYQQNEPEQVLPLKDALKVAELSYPISSMSCMCRKIVRARDERSPDEYSCTGLGVGMLKWERWPERYRGGVHFMGLDEAKEWLTKWDKAGMVHIIMVYGSSYGGRPYVGGVCNCDYPDCVPLRTRLDYGVTHSLLKSHYVARVDYDRCNGCGICAQRCQFGAIKMEITKDKANIDMFKCFGCGVCETGCPRSAITLPLRSEFPALREEW